MKKVLIVLLALTSLSAYSTDYEVCLGRENIRYNAIELNKADDPIFVTDEDSCIERIIDTNVASSKVWQRSLNGIHEFRNKYTFRKYIAAYPNGYKCIDTYAEGYSESNDRRFLEGIDFYTKSLDFIVSNSLAVIPNAIDKFDRKSAVKDFLKRNHCE